MKHIFCEIYQCVKNSGKWGLLYLCLCTMLFGVQVFMATFSSSQEFQKNHFASLQEEQIYPVVDNFVGQAESDLFQKANRIELLSQLIKRLQSVPQSTYFEVYDQTIMIKELKWEESLLYGYPNGNIEESNNVFYKMATGEEFYASTFNCLWLDDYALNVFPLKLIKGNLFSPEDYSFNDKKEVALIAGYNFKEYVNIGDTFDLIDYVGNQKGVIVGILSEDSFLEKNGKIINLNNYFIHPMQNICTNITNEAQYFEQIVLSLMKINGAFQSYMPAEYLQAQVGDIFNDLSLSPPLTVAQAQNKTAIYLSVKLTEMARNAKVAALSFTLFFIVVSIISCYFLYLKSKNYCSILYCNGFTLREIKIVFTGQAIVFLFVGFLMGLLFNLLFIKIIDTNHIVFLPSILLGMIILCIIWGTISVLFTYHLKRTGGDFVD